MSERELEDAVMELAALLGYMRYHALPAQIRPGKWATATKGETGWPDLVLCGNARLIFAELKAKRGNMSCAQADWRDALVRAGQEFYLWRPKDWEDGTIERILRNGHGGTAALGRLVRSA